MANKYPSTDMASRQTREQQDATSPLPLVFPEEWLAREPDSDNDASRDEVSEGSPVPVEEDDDGPDTLRIDPPN